MDGGEHTGERVKIIGCKVFGFRLWEREQEKNTEKETVGGK